jgi:hypothetical protein
MLYKEICILRDIKREFEDYGRETSFSDEGLEAIMNFYNELEEDIELDVIAICSSWSELSEEEIRANNCFIDDDEDVFEYLSKHTIASELSDTILYKDY